MYDVTGIARCLVSIHFALLRKLGMLWGSDVPTETLFPQLPLQDGSLVTPFDQ